MLKKSLLFVLLIALSLTAIVQLGGGAKIAAKAWLSQYLIEQAWSRTLLGEERVRPWPWADTWPVAELSVPSLGVQQVVLHGDSGRVLAFGPGMNDYVDGGLGLDFSILSGHRDTHFRFLKDLKLNDVFVITTADGKRSDYQIINTEVVNQNWLLPELEPSVENLMILATCYPFDTLTAGAEERFLVFAIPLKNRPVS
ncbi:hypothetical protein A3740_01935 [Oleiphilus sp. HI0068]|uniref:class GN sortase n=2 Tax=unclassified Oleiphilus TaxID=2631174 RepID=UPI0007C2C676|nr:class GN sortase [Oleiphilus sp. HI0132]KZY76362.1 hypothetical protein A3740_01935 [Oleiphilus sp. HI0068]KZY86919.1 hypothetical protein A3741_25935 [Oleiphilus sp. HI0069]KZZ45256.1 hypothetical protein A3755_03190 [Oleiphilus sp. HI0085]KZY87714.1 hypothetical protein A3741_13285 [Oleiphilus sp. HI0069]KZZ78517.1 hypothetical protein A3766_11290 [Oleiphilus sp. HI0132]